MMSDTLLLLAELLVLFFSVAFLVHIAQRWLGAERLRSWMGGTPLVSALKGIGLGFVTPFCTYSAVPMLLGLQRAGVPAAGYVAFIVAAPVLDPVLFGALGLIVGWQAALVYSAVAFAGAMGLAMMAERFDVSRFLKPVTEAALVGAAGNPSQSPNGSGLGIVYDDCGDSCVTGSDRPWNGVRLEAGDAAAQATSLLKSLGPVLFVGVMIGVAIEVFVPADLVASVAGEGNRFAIPIAAALGVPLYVNTGLFVPIADSLASVGVGIGAIVALTIAGAGANVPEFVILSKITRGRVLAVFATFVLLVAIAGGLLAQVVTAA